MYTNLEPPSLLEFLKNYAEERELNLDRLIDSCPDSEGLKHRLKNNYTLYDAHLSSIVNRLDLPYSWVKSYIVLEDIQRLRDTHNVNRYRANAYVHKTRTN